MSNLINESHHLKRRILFEEIPSGQRFLTPIVETMRDSCTIDIEHQKFDGNPYRVEIEPGRSTELSPHTPNPSQPAGDGACG